MIEIYPDHIVATRASHLRQESGAFHVSDNLRNVSHESSPLDVFQHIERCFREAGKVFPQFGKK